jgi:aspartyl-tRNA(Asn)/glutamyl-tRNA(Gln) amidotransferase subunit B
MSDFKEHSDETYEAVIGLEVHAQLRTASKAFCGCSTSFGMEPNSNVCPVCLGMPGVLPVLNRNLVEYIIRMGLATNCSIAQRSVFARKNYFYPDLPKGYQISQFEEPICTRGYIEIDLSDATRKRIGITRIHMEEDAGKSIHDQDADTLIDVNRCGVPLIEIVSEPDIRSPEEAYMYLSRIKQIVTYIDVCDGNMEEGSLRCDANVSVRRKGETAFGTKTEVKNMNSFRNVERALHAEIARQIDMIKNGEDVVQQTLLWDADRNAVVPMRSKEEAHDYRYFPDPDLVPVMVDTQWIKRIQAALPELPAVRRDRFIEEYGLPSYDADVLTVSRDLADYFELAVGALASKAETGYKAVSNWVMGDVMRVLKDHNIVIGDFPVEARNIGILVDLIQDGTISGKIAKDVFELMLTDFRSPEILVGERGLMQVTDAATVEPVVKKVIDDHPEEVRQFRDGKSKVLGFFVGKVMQETKGKANPKLVNELIKKLLDEAD